MLVSIGCICVLFQLALCLPSPKVTYNGHKVLEILHKTEDDFKKLLSMELKFELDIWKMPKHVNDSMYVRVGPQHLAGFVNELGSLNTAVSTLVEDVQQLIDTHSSPRIHQSHSIRRAVNTKSSGMNLFNYHTHASINNYLAFLTTEVLPNGVTATVKTLGTSVEGRSVQMIRISSPYGGPKRGIFIDGGIHAREWIAPATVIYVIEHLAYNPNNDAGINTLLNHFDVYLVPVVNPDGYEYTDHFRLWRKNRSVNGRSGCLGVDLNRNFPFHWDPAVGGSTDPCSDIYSGSYKGSEPETANIVNYLLNYGSEFDAYLTVHSYGQMWLYPWGYTSALPNDYLDLDAAAGDAVAAIKNLHHQKYTIGSSTNTLYAAAGGSDDFAKGGAGIKYAYTIELRDTGTYGFSLPTSLVQPTAEEFLAGFLAFAKNIYIKENGK
ncbi:carboxypeptidase B-like [Mercenaria mercenaria]|uniref:carboxypeptidase B-like n=1 Tax=Mercenaria mercenaria TaxID=6596 RepID=UPI00234F70A5|nr:carboxypeptidase B-like [Mercenaria mercenaria]